MTDVNQEADMGYVRDFVQKIAEALVAATELPKQINSMQADLNDLHRDLEKTKARNIELDTLTGDLRRQRDEAEQALSTAKNDANMANNALAIAKSQADNLQHDLEVTRTELVNVRKERDDYGIKQMEAEDRATKAETTLKELRKLMGMPEPQPESVKPTVYPDPVPPIAIQAEPTPNSPKRVYEGEYGYNDLNYHTEQFDYETKRYYRTA